MKTKYIIILASSSAIIIFSLYIIIFTLFIIDSSNRHLGGMGSSNSNTSLMYKFPNYNYGIVKFSFNPDFNKKEIRPTFSATGIGFIFIPAAWIHAWLSGKYQYRWGDDKIWVTYGVRG